MMENDTKEDGYEQRVDDETNHNGELFVTLLAQEFINEMIDFIHDNEEPHDIHDIYDDYDDDKVFASLSP